MIRPRPSSIIQSNDAPSPRIVANANTIKKDSIDCGITAIGCCNSAKCHKLGTSKLFLTLLILLAICQGTIERYFTASAKQTAIEYDYDPVVLDWLLVSSGIFQGIFAVIIAYWANRIHRISWLGGILIFQAIVSLSVIIPVLTHNDENNETIGAYRVDSLCTARTTENLMDEKPHSITTLVLMFILQLGIAFGNIVFYTLGLSYIDDNILEHYTPAFFGAILAAKYWGYQWGSAFVYAIAETPFGWWFGWTILSPILFILAVILALFPKRLLRTVVRLAADNIVEEATNNSQLSLNPHKLLADISFLNSVRRMLTNKILMFNILASCIIEVAIFNYFFHENSYLQSRFFLPADTNEGIRNEWTSKMLTSLLKPPLIGLLILTGGLIIAKANPNPRKIAAWNIITATIVGLLFVAFIFMRCNHNSLAGAYNGKLIHPFCSKSCICDTDIRFSPVCPEDSVQTYYSPCHAGCSEAFSSNGLRIFTNCSCGVDTEIPMKSVVATDGACGYEDCQKMWILYQILTVASSAFLGSALIGKVLITIRSVLPQDKSLALSMELSLIGLMAYIPGKIAYKAIADATCQYWSQDTQICYMQDSITFGNYLNITSACLIAVSVLLYVFVFIFVKDLPLYGLDHEATGYHPIPLQPMTTSGTRFDSPAPQNPEILQHEPYYPRQPSPQVHSSPQSISPTLRQVNGRDTPDSVREELNFTPQNMENSDTNSIEQRNRSPNPNNNNINHRYLESEVL